MSRWTALLIPATARRVIPMRDPPYGLPDADVPVPECSADADCGDARECIDGSCEPLTCAPCEGEAVCIQGCCQGASEERGLCDQPLAMELGRTVQYSNITLLRRDRWRPDCQLEDDIEEGFAAFTPDATDVYCIRSSAQGEANVVFLRTHCCAEPAGELACARSDDDGTGISIQAGSPGRCALSDRL